MQQSPDYSVPQPQSSYPQQPAPQSHNGETWQIPPPLNQQQGYPAQSYGQPQQGYAPQQFGQPGQQQIYPQQQQQMYQPQPVNVNVHMQPQQPMMVNQVVQVNVAHQQGPGLFVRALYFIFIGWWAGYIWLNLGFLLCAFIVTLPVGLIMLNRIPQVLTLRPQGKQTNVQVATVMTQGSTTSVINVNISGTKQYNFFIRAIYFIFIGSWVGYFWASLGYFICCTVIGLPLGLLMLNRLPMVLTLRRN